MTEPAHVQHVAEDRELEPEQRGEQRPVTIAWSTTVDPERFRRIGDLLADILDNVTHSRRG